MKNHRFELKPGQKSMWAVVTRGNGGFDMLDYCQVPIPSIGSGEILLRVLAAGVNNTEINTRLGWYSSSVTDATEDFADQQEQEAQAKSDGGWNEATPFPFIQGTDCCGEVVEVADDKNTSLMGKRVLVRACMRPDGFDSFENIWMASDFDGAFAQFVKVPASEVFPVECSWTDAELATIPCAWATAENMIHRAKVGFGQTVLIAGASGGVGSAAVQLCKRRGAKVVAIAGKDKMQAVLGLGADQVLERKENPAAVLGSQSVDVVIDNVGGDGFPDRLETIKRGGVFVSSGAIAGPIVDLDLRTFYLRDLTMIGCTAWDEPVFPDLVSYIEKGEIRPLLAKTFPLKDIAIAQEEFLLKKHVGNFVLIPPK